MMCGGTTEMKSPDDESSQMLATVKDQFHEKAGTSGEGLISLTTAHFEPRALIQSLYTTARS